MEYEFQVIHSEYHRFIGDVVLLFAEIFFYSFIKKTDKSLQIYFGKRIETYLFEKELTESIHPNLLFVLHSITHVSRLLND